MKFLNIQIIHKKQLFFLIIFFFIMLILIKPSFASFNVSVIPIKDHIDYGGTASFIISIENTGNTTERYEINYFIPYWTVFIPQDDIIYGNTVIKPGDRYTFNVNLIPSSLVTKNSVIKITLSLTELKTHKIKKIPLLVYYDLATEKYHYSPLVYMSAGIYPSNIDPRKKFRIKVTLMNENPLNYSNLTLIFVSSKKFRDSKGKYYHLINDEKTVSLSTRKTEVKNFIFQLKNPKESPKNDSLFIFLQYNKQLLAKVTNLHFNIKGYHDLIKYPVLKGGRFPVYYWNYTFYNNGTLSDNVKVKFLVSWFDKWLTYSNIKPSYFYISNNKNYEVWNLDLYPNERKSLNITVNYWLPLIILIIIFGLIVLYYSFRSPIIIHKSVSSVNTGNGGISDMKILIDVKNRKNKKIKNVSIIEYVPSIAGIDPNFEVGSLRPSKILTNSKKGTILKWDLELLNPLEERIITYHFKPKLTLIGDFTLPVALVKFNYHGSIRTVKSNSFYVKT